MPRNRPPDWSAKAILYEAASRSSRTRKARRTSPSEGLGTGRLSAVGKRRAGGGGRRRGGLVVTAEQVGDLGGLHDAIDAPGAQERNSRGQPAHLVDVVA